MTFKDPTAHRLQCIRFTSTIFVCYQNNNDGVWKNQQLPTNAAKPVAGTTHTISDVRNTSDVLIQNLSADTDYWVRFGSSYGNESPWSYIRTASVSTGPTITISGGSAVTEGTAASFTVTADTAPTTALTVNLSVSEAAGSDYVASTDEGAKTVTIAANQTQATYTVDTDDDSTDEPNGSVTVTVTSSTDYNLGTTRSASVTVNDNDAPAVAPCAASTNDFWDESNIALTATQTTIQITVTTQSNTNQTYELCKTGSSSIHRTTTTSARMFLFASLDANTQYWARARNAADGTSSWVAVKTLANAAPTVANAIPDQPATVGIELNYAFPHNTFADTDGDALTYTATQSDGTALPTWLTFTAATRTFSGTPQAANVGTLTVKVTASDSTDSVSDEFDIVVKAAVTGPTVTIEPGAAVTEGTAATFTVRASAAPSSNLDVTVNVSETGGGDFVTSANEGAKTVTIASGSTTATLSVATAADTVDESMGTVTAQLAAGSGYNVGTASTARVTVHDDDGAGISSVAFTNQPSVSTWGIGGVIEITATFDQAVTVGTTGGTPSFALTPAFGPNGETRHASYVSGSDSTALVFRYTVAEGDSSQVFSNKFVRVAANALALNGGTIRAGSADADLAHAVASSSFKDVYAVRGAISHAFALPVPAVDADLDGEAETFTAATGNNEIKVWVDFQHLGGGGTLLEVDNQGSNANVQVVVDIGGTDVTLDYISTNRGTLEFGTHTVVAANADSDGIVLERDASGNVIRLRNGATVKGSEANGGNDADRTASADVGVRVDETQATPLARVRGTNAVPTGADFTKSTANGTALTFAKADFGFSDTTDNDPMKAIQVVTLPAATAGSLELDGTAIPSTDLPKTVTHTELDDGKLKFVPSDVGDTSFTFKVVDSFDGVAASANTATVRVTARFVAGPTAVSLVGNLGKSLGGTTATLSTTDVAQGFHTGNGAILESVTVRFVAAPSGLTVKVGSGQAHSLTSPVTLTNPSLAAGNLTFTAPANTALSEDTDYWVVIEGTGGTVAATLTSQEDAGGAANWNIHNLGLKRNPKGTGGFTSDEVLSNHLIRMIRVNGKQVTVPAAPAAPTVSAVSETGLLVEWSAPTQNGNSAITDYDLRWREQGSTSVWGEPASDTTDTATSARITGLTAGKTYEVQVRAQNAVDVGDWSASGVGATAAPGSAPILQTLASNFGETADASGPDFAGSAGSDFAQGFTTGGDAGGYRLETVTVRVASASTNVKVRIAKDVSSSSMTEVVGMNPDPAPSLAAGNHTFTPKSATVLEENTKYWVVVEGASGTVGVTLTHGQTGWSIDDNHLRRPHASASDAGFGTSVSSPVLIAIDGVGASRPAAPSAPTVSTVSTTELQVQWSAPEAGSSFVPAVTDYDLRWREKGTTAWSEPETDGTDTATHGRIAGLTAGKTYEVQVRAQNAVDAGDWSAAGLGATPATVAGLCTHPSAVEFVDGGQRATGGPDRPTGCVEPFELHELMARWQHENPEQVTAQRVAFRPSEPAGQAWTTTDIGFSAREWHVSTVASPAAPLDPNKQYDVRVRAQANGQWGEWGLASGVRPSRFVASYDAARVELVRIVSQATADQQGSDGVADTYVAGDVILVDVEMDRTVAVTGANSDVTLALEIGGGTENVPLQSVLYSGRTLRFAHTVVAGNSDTDGVRVLANAAGDAVSVAATAAVSSADTGAVAILAWGGLPLAAGAEARVDGSTTTRMGPVPQPGMAAVNGATLTVTFDKALKWAYDGGVAANLEVRSTDVHGGHRNAYQHPSAVRLKTGDSKTIVLTLGVPVTAGDSVTLSHFYAGGAQVLRDAGNDNPAPTFRDLAVRNDTPGTAGPEPERADVAGESLRVVFDRALDASATPPGNAFSVRATDNNLGARTIAGTGTVSVTGREAFVTLAAAARPDEQASVSYAAPASGAKLQASASGNAAVLSFRDFALAAIHDVTPPNLLSAPANILQTRANDPLMQGKSRIMLYFDERLDRASVPAVADFALSSTHAGAVPGAAVASVTVEDTAVNLVTSHWLKDNVDYTLVYTPGAQRIKDLAGNAVAGFTETISSFSVGQPVLRGSTVSGTRLELNMANPLNPGAVPPPSAFGLWEKDVQAGDTELRELSNRVLSVMVSSAQVVLQLAHPVYPCAGQTVFRVSYTPPASGGERLQTAAGWGADGWTADKWRGQADDHALATNGWHGRCTDWLAGTFMGSVVLQAARPFSRDRGEPEPGWFTVSASGGPVAVTRANFSPHDPKELKLELSREFVAGETAMVSYRRPAGASGLWDVDGNQLRDVLNAPVRAKAATQPVLAVADAAANEGGALAFAVTLDAAAGSEVTVDWATADGTATAGSDYTAASGTLSFAAGETSKTVTVEALADTAAEGDETFTLTLSNAVGATLGDAQATGTVADGDRPLTAAFRGLPAQHDGSRRFAFEIVFSEEFEGLRLTALEAGGLEVVNGRLIDVKRTVRGENRSVTARARPSSDGPVTLTLKATADCLAADAICTADGRRLSAAVSATVAGPGSAPPTLAVADALADEGGTLSFAVTLGAASGGEVTVDWGTSDGTATAGTDYTAGSGTLVFSAGETSKTVLVATLADRVLDEGETVTLALSNPSGATLGDAEATGTIADVAVALPVVDVADASASEGGTLAFVVTLDTASDAAVTVDWATADGTATAGSDYAAASGTLTFVAGETSKTVGVAALHDAEVESDETFTVTLSNVSGATLGDALATGTVAEVAPLTAYLAGVPAEHDGTNAFSFELAFGDDFAGAMDGATLAGAFTVGNGTATGAVRIVAGQNRRWTVTVHPSSTDDVTLSLAAGAVTTETGRPLANGVSATVAGPALLSVADAEADEGKTLSFAVTLDRAATGTVTVDWAISDGTATAGSDYTSASGTLTFSAGETAKTVSVQALTDNSAEDDETFTLSLSNASGAAIADGAATGTVIDVPPLTASFANLPAEHDGSHRFGFEIVFSEEFDGMRLTAFAAGALQVTGGRLIDAKRAVRGQNRRVAVRVRPDSNSDLTLTLASAADCNAASAICAKDGRVLSNTATATVSGPALVSVGDVEATEGEDEHVVFTVSLNRAAAGTATVDYATADRTAHAGDDYAAVSGTLTFAAGETSKTVSVPLLDDAIDDDGETFALELNNAQGAALGDRVGLATIRNSDPVPKAWLVRFSRAATDHAADAVQRRFDDRGAESHATLGGHRLWGPGSLFGNGKSGSNLFSRPTGLRSEGTLPSSGGDGILPSSGGDGTLPSSGGDGTLASSGGEGILPSQAPEGRHARHGGSRGTLAGGRPLWTEGILPSTGGEGILPSQAPGGRHARHGGSTSAFGPTPTLHDLLQGSSFLLSLTNEEESATPRRLTTWGNAAATRFDGLDGNVSVDGEIATYLLGADLEWNRWLAGVALAHSVGQGGFQADTPGHKSGALDSSLTAMHPYLRWRASDRVSAWGMLGYGKGTLDLVVDETKPGWTTDTSMRMAAAGMRGVLSRTGGTELAAKLDARLSHIASDSAESASGLLGDTAGGTSRLRLALEGSRAFAVGTSRMLTPTLDLGLRHDGGDAETGAGVDLGGTLRYADAHLGLTAEASGRWLLAHEDAAYREWGASATVRVDPGTSGRGLSLSLQPSWGATATGGADRLWSLQDARGLASGGYGMDDGMRLATDVGWTFDWFRGKGAMRPFLGMRMAGPARDWRAGIGWLRGQNLEFGFETTRRESPTEPPDHGIELRLEWRPAHGTAFRAVPSTPENPPPTPAEPTEAPPEG